MRNHENAIYLTIHKLIIALIFQAKCLNNPPQSGAGVADFRINLAIKFDGFENAVKVVAKDTGGISLKYDSLVAELEDADNTLIFIIQFASVDVDIVTIYYGGRKGHIARANFFSILANRLVEESALNTYTKCHYGIFLNYVHLTWIKIGSVVATTAGIALHIETPSLWIFET